jgi:flagellar hook-length control protein FliK
MSADKTLVSMPAPGTEPSRRTVSAFDIPLPKVGRPTDGVPRADEARESFLDLLSAYAKRTQQRAEEGERGAARKDRTRAGRSELERSRADRDRTRRNEMRERDEEGAHADAAAAPEPERDAPVDPDESAKSERDDATAAAEDAAEHTSDESEETAPTDTDANGESTSAEPEPTPDEDDVQEAPVAQGEEAGTAEATEAAATDPGAGTESTEAQLLRQLASQSGVQSVVSQGAQAEAATAESGEPKPDPEVRQPVVVKQEAPTPEAPPHETAPTARPATTAPEAEVGKLAQRVATHAALQKTEQQAKPSQAAEPTEPTKPQAIKALEAVGVRITQAPTEIAFHPAVGHVESQQGELARLLASAAGLVGGNPAQSSPAQAVQPVTTGQTGGQTTGDPAQSSQPQVATVDSGRSGDTLATRTSATGTFARTLAQQQTTQGEAARNVERAVEVVRASAGARNSSITLRLEPPELGRMQMDVRLRSGVLTVRVEVDTAAAREMLSGRLGDLRQALQRHGITIERFDIEARPPAPHAQNSHTQDRQGADPGGSHPQSSQGQPSNESEQQFTRSHYADNDQAGIPEEIGTPDDDVSETEPAEELAGLAVPTAETSVNVWA